MKKSLVGLLFLLVAFGLIGCSKKEAKTSVTAEAQAEATEEPGVFGPEEDAFILYNFCHQDGKILKGESSDTIAVAKEDTKTTYTFTEHVLSCGTHMNGVITEETKGNEIIVTANFDVTENPYEIIGLVVEYTKNTDTDEYVGTLTENGKVIDINRYYK